MSYEAAVELQDALAKVLLLEFEQGLGIATFEEGHDAAEDAAQKVPLANDERHERSSGLLHAGCVSSRVPDPRAELLSNSLKALDYIYWFRGSGDILPSTLFRRGKGLPV